jgi:hypothetical protein
VWLFLEAAVVSVLDAAASFYVDRSYGGMSGNGGSLFNGTEIF